MGQTNEDLMQTLKHKNEIDIVGIANKVEVKPQIQKPNGKPENANQDEVEIKNENQARDQNQQNKNALLIEETIGTMLENVVITSYICGEDLNSGKNSTAQKRKSLKNDKVDNQNNSEKAVHKKIKSYECDLCGKSFSQSGTLGRHKKNSHG